jgi:hypothetical protein
MNLMTNQFPDATKMVLLPPPELVQQWWDEATCLDYAPTLMERALAGDATAAKQFLHEAGFTDKHGQWLPQYQPIPETTND